MLRRMSTHTPVATTISNTIEPTPLSGFETALKNVFGVLQSPLSGFETALKNVFGVLQSPLYLLGHGFIKIPASHTVVLQRFGKYEGTRPEGLHFILPWSLEYNEVFTKEQSYQLEPSKILDSRGNPIIMSSVVNYKITDPVKFILNIRGDTSYIVNQSNVVIKRVASKYPYDCDEGMGLKNETLEIGKEMRDALQKATEVAGATIESVMIDELSYAPEIASQMLVKQQAEQYVRAKKEITESSVDIVNEIIERMKEHDLSSACKEQLIINLMTTITSGDSVQTTLPLKQLKNNTFNTLYLYH
jgi:hypothetical protein